jgi:ABC-type dipeptide/oligopeptide/nickel transport system permease component
LGTVAFFGVLIVVFNLVTDIIQALMDPKSQK